MTGLRYFHTSALDFATKVITAVESQRGDSDRSSRVIATISFAGDEVRRDIAIACTTALPPDHWRGCIVVRGNRDTSTALGDLEAHGKVRSRAGPRMHPTGQGPLHATSTRYRRIRYEAQRGMEPHTNRLF